jgi:putative transcriptional regulator
MIARAEAHMSRFTPGGRAVPTVADMNTDTSELSREALGANLAQARSEAGFTQREAAAELGIGDSSLSDWERGDRAPNVFTLARLAEIYKTSLDYLVLGRHPRPVEGPSSDELAALRILLRQARRSLMTDPQRSDTNLDAAEQLIEGTGPAEG